MLSKGQNGKNKDLEVEGEIEQIYICIYKHLNR